MADLVLGIERRKHQSEQNRASSLVRMYESAAPIGTSELNREKYLASLPITDRNNLLFLVNSLFPDNLTRVGSYALFAVGTTTYPDSYWAGLAKYLKDKDPEKLAFVNRHGEDIDLQICAEHEGFVSTALDLAFKVIRRTLKQNNLKFRVENDKSEGGTGYIHFKKEQNSPLIVERYKHIDYGKRKIKIQFPNSRPFHLFFDESSSVDNKLKIERTQDHPFTLLFRHNNYPSLEDSINLINGYENQRNLNLSK